MSVFTCVWSLGSSHLAHLQSQHLILEAGEEGRKKREEAETKTVNFYYVSLQRMQRYKDDSVHARKDGQGLAKCALSARPRPLWAPTRAAHGTSTAQCTCWGGGRASLGRGTQVGQGRDWRVCIYQWHCPAPGRGRAVSCGGRGRVSGPQLPKPSLPKSGGKCHSCVPLSPVGRRSEMTGWASTAPRFHNPVRGGQPPCLAPGDRVLGAGQLGRRWGELPGISS